MFGALGGALAATGVTFVSKAAREAGIGGLLGLRKSVVAVQHTRKLGKRSLIHNDYTPKIEVDPQTYEVRADGALLRCEPAEVLPLAQRYFLF
jgi:urease subunit alpha